MITAGVLLAAGRSSRFGADNKLLASLSGRPLVAHAAAAMQGAGFDHHVAVISDSALVPLLAGYTIVRIDPDAPDQSDSLKAGLAEAERLDADLLVVALGDMPRITAQTLKAVTRRAAMHGASATTDGVRRMPPAGFGKEMFAALAAATGDAGARPFLRALDPAALVRVQSDGLVDIDTVSQLKRAQVDGQ